MIALSRLEEIKDLRTVWPHEALDFTPWLSQDDNIALLADAIGLDITVDETESSVGDFNVDIFASETGTDRKIIIENQLEDTNHDHLGKLITYASGKSANVIVWVVKHAREEHRYDRKAGIAYADCIMLYCFGQTGTKFSGSAGRNQYQRYNDKSRRACKHIAGLSGQRRKTGADTEYIFRGFCDSTARFDERISTDSVSECGGCSV